MSRDDLSPDSYWVTNPDPNYDEPCPACSALVENRALHRAWHLALADRVDAYRPPPRYGGIQ